LALTLTLRAILVFFNKKITYNLKTTDQILAQFYMVTYLSWFNKSNKD